MCRGVTYGPQGSGHLAGPGAHRRILQQRTVPLKTTCYVTEPAMQTCNTVYALSSTLTSALTLILVLAQPLTLTLTLNPDPDPNPDSWLQQQPSPKP